MRWTVLASFLMLAATVVLTSPEKTRAESPPSSADSSAGPLSSNPDPGFPGSNRTQQPPSLAIGNSTGLEDASSHQATGAIAPKAEVTSNESPCITPSGENCEAPRFWFQTDYLMWWTRGYHIPPLVTSSPVGTPRQEIGVLGAPETSILFGDSDYHGNLRSGVRLHAGTWFDEPYCFGIEGDWIRLENSFATPQFESDESRYLGRPIYNGLLDQADAQYLPVGNLGVRSTSDFSSAGLSLFKRWCVCDACSRDGCNPSIKRWTTVKLTGGYRYHALIEGISLDEFVSSGDPFIPVSMRLNDSFSTRNEFHGGEIGIVRERHSGRWSTELSGKIGLGNTQQHVSIHGNTATTTPSGTYDYDAGFLALRSNSGDYNRNCLSMIAEIGCRLGCDVTDHPRMSIGYTLLYWGNTARPGDQIDTVLNPNLFPPEVSPLTGPLRPAFAWRDSDFWAQGIDVAIDLRW
jgi:hypothetical protein